MQMKLADAGCTGFGLLLLILILILWFSFCWARQHQSETIKVWLTWLTVCLFSACFSLWLTDWQQPSIVFSRWTLLSSQNVRKEIHMKREKKRSTDSRSVYNLYSYIRMEKVRFQSVYPSVFPSLILKFSDCLKLLSLSVCSGGRQHILQQLKTGEREKRTRVKNWNRAEQSTNKRL